MANTTDLMLVCLIYIALFFFTLQSVLYIEATIKKIANSNNNTHKKEQNINVETVN